MTGTEPERRPAMRNLEAALPLGFVVFHGLFYNAVANAVTARRGADYGPVLATWLDERVPLVPLMVFPYMIAWVYPLFLVGGLVAKEEVGVVVVRRIVVSALLLELVCYALWIAFPVKFSMRVDEAELAALGWLGSLVRLNYENATAWHACPSFHIAGPWLFFRAAQLYRIRFVRTLLFVFIAIALSTVTIRIHYVLDIAGGLLVSEAAYRFVLLPLERRAVLGGIRSRTVVVAYAILLAVAAIAFALLLKK